MDVNDNAANLTPSGVFEFFASKLAPTGIKGSADLRAQKSRS
jgi:hypothetical protein